MDELSVGAKEYLRKKKRRIERIKAFDKLWDTLTVKQQVKILKKYQRDVKKELRAEKRRQRGCPYSGVRWY